jgi:hypothetical protein
MKSKFWIFQLRAFLQSFNSFYFNWMHVMLNTCIQDELPPTRFDVCYTNKHRHMEAAGDQYMCLTYYVPVPVATRCIWVSLWLLACWNCGFESHGGHGCLSVVSVVCCQVVVSVSGWPLVQRNPTCVAVCNLETSWMWRPWLTGGSCDKNPTNKQYVQLCGIKKKWLSHI